jgi:N-acetylglutamate synthase-like GNAT family acetyltransferase
MKIRKFKNSDAKRCNAIIYSCIDNAKKIKSKERAYLKMIYTKEKIKSFPKKSDFFVVTHNKKIVGTGRLEKSKIATIYFSSDFRKKGGGTFIILHLLKRAKSCGLKKVYVESLLQSTEFYKKLGFGKKKLLKKPIQSWKMEKKIN